MARRADAERSIAAILHAAVACFSADPDVTMAAIARAAGVGRVTLYAHFPSRELLLEAVVDRAVEASAEGFARIVEAGESAEVALRTLIRDSWADVDRVGTLFEAAQKVLGPQRLRQRHAPVLAGMERLVARGQADGSFRSDLPTSWLVTTIYGLFHAAAEDIDAGRLDPADAAIVLEATLLPALACDPGAMDDALPRISSPATRALAAAGISRLSQLTDRRADEILELHGVGPKAMRLLREALAARGLAFRDDAP